MERPDALTTEDDMAGSSDVWWRSWAPYWEHIAERHLGGFVTKEFASTVESPTLVVGVGQGPIVEHLRGQGIRAFGVDRSLETRSQGGPDIVGSVGGDLPFSHERFASVILSIGVLDHTDSTEEIIAVLDESFRVLRRGGALLVAFYQMASTEEILRKVGVIQGQDFYWSRLAHLRLRGSNPLLQIRGAQMVSRWTDRGFVPTLASYIKLGLSLPETLEKDIENVEALFRRAELDSVEPMIPERIPYRREREVRELFERAGFPCSRIDHHDECLIARCQRLTRRRGKRRTYGRSGARESSSWVVRTEEVSKRYPGAPKKAVDALSVLIERGTIFGILGPNGAGKTTTLSMLCGLLRPDAGGITFFDGLRGRELKRHIGYVPQELAIYPKLTALENMTFFGGLYGVRRGRLEQRIGELLDMVGLRDRENSLVETYSTGMQRRLNLAAGLIHEPQLILLDEPTVGIDPQSRNCIFEAVLELKRRGVSILYTTHYMEEASRLCDRIVIMDEGKIILEGNPREAVQEYGRIRIDLSVDAEGIDAGVVRSLEGMIWEVDFVEDCSFSDSMLTVGIDGSQDAMGAVGRIIELGESLSIGLSLTSVVEPNLETLFLEITGKSLRDEAA